MPIYEYECNNCGEQHEFIQKFSESPKRKCPSCGKLRLRKLISAAAFHLKGSGWYVTDFRDQDKKKPDADSSSTEASSAKTDSDAKSGKKPKDSTTSTSDSSKTKAKPKAAQS